MAAYLIVLVAGILSYLAMRKAKKIGHIVFVFLAVVILVVFLRSKGLL